MSFVGDKRSRGRRVAMSYVADDAAFSSGPGAIAAIDGASQRRRRARALAARVSAARDRKLASMTMGAIPALTTLARAAGTAVRPMITAGAAIGSPVRPGSINLAKYPTGTVAKPLIGTISKNLLGVRATVGARSSEPPVATKTGTSPGGGGQIVVDPSAFTTDPSGATCLSDKLMSNGYCPMVPTALPPATSSGGGGGGGDSGGGASTPATGGGAAAPDGGDIGPAIDTSELDTSDTGPTTVMTAPPPTATPVVSSSGMAALTANKPLLYLGLGVAAWWLFFRK